MSNTKTALVATACTGEGAAVRGSRVLAALAGLLLLAGSALAEEGPTGPEVPPIVSEAAARAALDRFAEESDTEDLDLRLDAIGVLGEVHHPKVADRLFRLLRCRETEIQVEAMLALGGQICYRERLEKKIAPYLDERRFEPRVVATTLKVICRLDLRRYEQKVIERINSDEDVVAISALRVLARWESFRSLKDILVLWEFYPEEGKWKTGAVTVETGGRTAARAKWHRKYGGRARRARPELVRAIEKTVNLIICLEEERRLTHPSELRKWIDEHKQLIRDAR